MYRSERCGRTRSVHTDQGLKGLPQSMDGLEGVTAQSLDYTRGDTTDLFIDPSRRIVGPRVRPCQILS